MENIETWNINSGKWIKKFYEEQIANIYVTFIWNV